MTPGSADKGTAESGAGERREGGVRPAPPPVLVLGLGNSLLGDDGIGLYLAELLAAADNWNGAQVEFVDGGTQGLALLHLLAGRSGLLMLDAVALGDSPGSVHILRGDQLVQFPHVSKSAHEANAADLLRSAALLGEMPRYIAMIGIEPKEMKTGIGFSVEVLQSVPAALAAARVSLEEIVLNAING